MDEADILMAWAESMNNDLKKAIKLLGNHGLKVKMIQGVNKEGEEINIFC